MIAASLSLLSSALLLAGGAVAGRNAKQAKCLDGSFVAHSGTPIGTEVKHGNRESPVRDTSFPVPQLIMASIPSSNPLHYQTRRKQPARESPLGRRRPVPHRRLWHCPRRKQAVRSLFPTPSPLPLLEVTHTLPSSLADSFARAGYLTIAPDLFSGSPAPGDINVPGFNTSAFLAAHPAAVTDPIIAAAASYLRSEHGITRIATPGYCFGGRYAFRAVGAAGGVADVGFAAHPSLLEAGEISDVAGPVAVAAADGDTLFNGAARAAAEDAFLEGKKTYQVTLYSGTQHGFGVRVNVSDAGQRWAKEQAFLQAVRWFDRFLAKGE